MNSNKLSRGGPPTPEHCQPDTYRTRQQPPTRGMVPRIRQAEPKRRNGGRRAQPPNGCDNSNSNQNTGSLLGTGIEATSHPCSSGTWKEKEVRTQPETTFSCSFLLGVLRRISGRSWPATRPFPGCIVLLWSFEQREPHRTAAVASRSKARAPSASTSIRLRALVSTLTKANAAPHS